MPLKPLRFFLTLLALACPLSTASAQSCSNTSAASCVVTAGATMVIPTVVGLSLSTTSSSAVPIESDMDNGYVLLSPTVTPTLSLVANTSWSIYISSAASTWTGTGTGVWVAKPASDLHWGTTSSPSTPLTTSNALIQTGPGTSTVGGITIPMYYKVMLDWVNNSPGAYSLTVKYTITAP